MGIFETGEHLKKGYDGFRKDANLTRTSLCGSLNPFNASSLTRVTRLRYVVDGCLTHRDVAFGRLLTSVYISTGKTARCGWNGTMRSLCDHRFVSPWIPAASGKLGVMLWTQARVTQILVSAVPIQSLQDPLF